MSGRYDDYKGSSRSTRDDSRQYKDVRKAYKDYERRSRSRSRSPRRRPPPPRDRKYSPSKSGKYSPSRSSRSQERDSRSLETVKCQRKSPTDWDSSDEEDVPAPPPPPRITPISIELPKPKGPIKMSLGGPVKVPVKKPLVASVFTEDDDDEEEEMPAEARMRMRNIGRETPTSAGPNSFGKTKQGFCDAKKVFEKNLKEALDTVAKPGASKFPQTIYKIKGP